jgi:hypothetical protein
MIHAGTFSGTGHGKRRPTTGHGVVRHDRPS